MKKWADPGDTRRKAVKSVRQFLVFSVTQVFILVYSSEVCIRNAVWCPRKEKSTPSRWAKRRVVSSALGCVLSKTLLLSNDEQVSRVFIGGCVMPDRSVGTRCTRFARQVAPPFPSKSQSNQNAHHAVNVNRIKTRSRIILHSEFNLGGRPVTY